MSYVDDLLWRVPWLQPLIPLVSLAVLLFTIWMIVDCIRHGREWYWILIMVVFWGIGAVIYFFVCKWGETGVHQKLRQRRRIKDEIQDLKTKIHHLDKAEHYAALGDLYQEQNHLAEAEQQYRAALARDAELWETAAHLGYVLLAQGKPDEAWTWLEAAVRRQPWAEYGRLLWEAARCQARRGQLDAARHLYRQLLTKHTYSEARLEYAEVLEKLGDRQGRTEVLQQLIAEAQHVPAFQRKQEAHWVRRAESMLRGL